MIARYTKVSKRASSDPGSTYFNLEILATKQPIIRLKKVRLKPVTGKKQYHLTMKSEMTK